MQPEVGGQISRYRVEAVLGQGGFASVYAAFDPELERKVAIKLLHPHLTANKAFVRRFRAEARAMARLRHAHIVPIYDVGETAEGRSYLVMALLDGVTLAQAIAQQAPLAEARAVSILAQLADALDYLHAQGFVHRDVKPANIMLHADDTVTLMDFGIARTLDDQAYLTQTGELVGTVTYMAPEQISGGPVGPATDLYSLGLVAYELFAGRPPFRGSASEVLDQQRTQPPPPLASLNPNVSLSVANAVAACLAKEPTGRPPSAKAFVVQLEGGPATETGIALAAQQQRLRGGVFRRRGRVALVAVGLLGAVALAFAVGALRERAHGKYGPPVSVPAGTGASPAFSLLGFATDTGPSSSPPADIVSSGGDLHACQPPELYAFLRFDRLHAPALFTGSWSLDGRPISDTSFTETLTAGVMFWSVEAPLPAGVYRVTVSVAGATIANGDVHLRCP